jgi:hypothetical protein
MENIIFIHVPESSVYTYILFFIKKTSKSITNSHVLQHNIYEFYKMFSFRYYGHLL